MTRVAPSSLPLPAAAEAPSVPLQRWLVALVRSGLTHSEFRVLAALVRCLDLRTESATVRLKWLEAVSGMKERRMAAVLKSLADSGLIIYLHRMRGGASAQQVIGLNFTALSRRAEALVLDDPDDEARAVVRWHEPRSAPVTQEPRTGRTPTPQSATSTPQSATSTPQSAAPNPALLRRCAPLVFPIPEFKTPPPPPFCGARRTPNAPTTAGVHASRVPDSGVPVGDRDPAYLLLLSQDVSAGNARALAAQGVEAVYAGIEWVARQQNIRSKAAVLVQAMREGTARAEWDRSKHRFRRREYKRVFTEVRRLATPEDRALLDRNNAIIKQAFGDINSLANSGVISDSALFGGLTPWWDLYNAIVREARVRTAQDAPRPATWQPVRSIGSSDSEGGRGSDSSARPPGTDA